MALLWVPRGLPASPQQIANSPTSAFPPKPRLPFAAGGNEGIQNIDLQKLTEIPKTPFLTYLMDQGISDTMHALGVPELAIEEIACKADLECFAQYSNKDLNYTAIAFRSREAAGLLPEQFQIGKNDQLPWNLKYVPLCTGYEPVIDADVTHGSGNFLSIRIVAWLEVERRFRDLMAGFGDADLPAEFADGYHALADLDGDGCKELIVTHGWKAINERTQFFRLRDGAFAEVENGSAMYQNFRKMAEQVRDQAIWEGPREADKGR